MIKDKPSSPNIKKTKTRSDLYLKLNTGMMWRYISGFISINILIIIFSFFLIFWKVDEGAYIIANTPGIISNNGQQIYFNINNYNIYELEELNSAKGFTFTNSFDKILPTKIKNAKRNLKKY